MMHGCVDSVLDFIEVRGVVVVTCHVLMVTPGRCDGIKQILRKANNVVKSL